MSNKFANVMYKIGWGMMIIGGITLIPCVIWIFTLTPPITDPKIVGLIENTIPLSLGGIIFAGGTLAFMGAIEMATVDKKD